MGDNIYYLLRDGCVESAGTLLECQARFKVGDAIRKFEELWLLVESVSDRTVFFGSFDECQAYREGTEYELEKYIA